MNILFLTLLDFASLQERNIYTDLLREFTKDGHKIYAISPVEKRKQQETHIITQENAVILKLRIGNTQKTNIIEKGISTILIEPQLIAGIKKYFSEVKFDLVIYSTPPITFCKVIEFVKKRDEANTYLLLKDIFPQNAVDLGMMRTSGVKGLLYKYFRKKEKKLYAISNRIGCMSQANVEYVLKYNREISQEKVEICPNSIDVQDLRLSGEARHAMRKKYEIPLDKKVFVYGGNLGKPQGIPFLIECLKTQEDNEEAWFLIVGDGTEYGELESWFSAACPQNMRLMKRLPKEDYDKMIAACDVGLIFLDYRFTIPNFPSRLLAYMQAGLPVLCCTDSNTDIGKVVTEGEFGWWCQSDDIQGFQQLINKCVSEDLKRIGENGRDYLQENYTAEKSYHIIMERT